MQSYNSPSFRRSPAVTSAVALQGPQKARYDDVTLVVPTLNEGPNLREFLRQAERALPGCSVVLSDDDSVDDTRALARSFRGDVHVHVLHRKEDRGLTASVADGILHVRTPYLVVMDADLQHPAEALPRLVMALREGSDVVVATRSNDASFTFRRRVLSRGARLLARGHLRRRAGLDLSDPMSGFFGGRADAVQAIVRQHGHAFERSGFKILLDLFLHAPSDLRVSEVPYVFQPRHAGESKLTRRHYVSFLRQLGSLGRFGAAFLDHLLSGLLLRFAVVGASGVLVNEAFLYAGVAGLGLPLILAALVAVEASVLWNFAWNEAWTFRGRGGGTPALRLGRFHVASAAGMVLNVGVVLAGAALLPQVSYLVTNLAGIVLGSGVNFLVNLHWTWGVNVEEESSPLPDAQR